MDEPKALTLKQRRFFEKFVEYHLSGCTIPDAKHKAFVDVYGEKSNFKDTRHQAIVAFNRIRKRITDEDLEAYGLGRETLFSEIRKRLEAKKPIIVRGEVVGEYPDEQVRMTATALLADILKLKGPSASLTVNTQNQTLIIQVMSEEDVKRYMDIEKELRGKYEKRDKGNSYTENYKVES